MIHCDTIVQLTPKGFGIFATRNFKKGEILWLIDDFDVKIPIQLYKNLDPIQRSKLDIYSYMDFQNRVIVPWDEGKFVNHSCEPNATGLIEFDNVTIALKDINEGEEILENYNSYFAHFETFDCQCGTINCRKIISETQSYRPELRLKLEDIIDEIKSFDQFVLKIQSNESKGLFELLNSKH